MLLHDKDKCPHLVLLGTCIFNAQTGEHHNPLDFVVVKYDATSWREDQK